MAQESGKSERRGWIVAVVHTYTRRPEQVTWAHHQSFLTSFLLLTLGQREARSEAEKRRVEIASREEQNVGALSLSSDSQRE